jgi:hypothetical protein
MPGPDAADGLFEALETVLGTRFAARQPLTRLHPCVAVSLNPFSRGGLASGKAAQAQDASVSGLGLDPAGLEMASFAELAETAVARLATHGADQGIVLTGESGAGKTTACRAVIDRIAGLCGEAFVVVQTPCGFVSFLSLCVYYLSVGCSGPCSACNPGGPVAVEL